MRRISPTNPVRRCLFPEDDAMKSQANKDNLENQVKEIVEVDRIRAIEKYNFDIEHDLPLDGDYVWTKIENDAWIGKFTTKMDCDDQRLSTKDYVLQKMENEATPKTNTNNEVAVVRKRKAVVVSEAREVVKKKIDFDCNTL